MRLATPSRSPRDGVALCTSLCAFNYHKRAHNAVHNSNMKAHIPMKTLLAAALLCGVSGHAYANIVCNITDQRNNSLVYTFMNAADKTAFAEVSMGRNGSVTANDPMHMPLWTISTNDNNHTFGLSSRVDPSWNLTMYVRPSPDAGGVTLFHNNNQAGGGRCYNDALPAENYVPVAKPAPAPVASNGSHIPINIENQRAHIIASLGSQGVTMLIDTGATTSLVTEDIANRLLASGEATELAHNKVQIADGTIIDARNISINYVTIGGHTLSNVRAGVSGNNAEPLLGFDALNAIASKFAINTRTSMLDLD